MPKTTFFNLAEEKQNTIIANSIKEFSKGTYKEVKISALIKSAGIPRSSFYDYFEDKLDLYKYIIDKIGQKKAEGIGKRQAKDNFFDELRDILLEGVRFIVLEPELDAVAKYFLADEQLVRELYGDTSLDVSIVFKQMLQKGLDDGIIRQDIDIDFIAKTINLLATGLMVEGAMEKDKSIEEVISEMADKMIDFIRLGIGN